MMSTGENSKQEVDRTLRQDGFVLPDLSGKKVTVMGLGLFGGGVASTRFLLQLGATVTVTDLRPPELLKESISSLEGLPVRYVLGEHRLEDFLSADMILVNPAVPKNSPYLVAAANKGIPIETEINIFFKHCPCPIIGVTGTQGKTTTTTLIGAILNHANLVTWTGGNLGYPLIEDLQAIKPHHFAVLELSSFQLEYLNDIRMSPQIAVATNIYPNHLDRHGTMQAYIAAKKTIVAHQTPDSFAVINYDDNELRKWLDDLPGKPLPYSLHHQMGGAYTRNGFLVTGDGVEIMPLDEIPLLGAFNVSNVLAAATVASALNIPPQIIRDAVRNFRPVQHRLQLLRDVNGVAFYDDSVATTPTATTCALRSFNRKVILIAGGYDKNLPLEELIDEIMRKVKVLVLYGATAEKVARAVQSRNQPGPIIIQTDSLESAIEKARSHAIPGDVVLYSPAFASYDMFRNFTERARIYQQMVSSF